MQIKFRVLSKLRGAFLPSSIDCTLWSIPYIKKLLDWGCSLIGRVLAWCAQSPGLNLHHFYLRFTIAVMKHRDHNQLGKERLYFALQWNFTVH